MKLTLQESSHDKAVIFMPILTAEWFLPPKGSHLIALSDGEHDQALINPWKWESISYHHCLDAEYSVKDVLRAESNFRNFYKGNPLPETAQSLRERIRGIGKYNQLVVVTCPTGNSLCAAVADYVHKSYGHELTQSTKRANTTLQRLLFNDRPLIDAIQKVSLQPESGTLSTWWQRVRYLL